MTYFSNVVTLAVNNPLLYKLVLNIFGKIRFKRDLRVTVKGLNMHANTPDRWLAALLWKFSLLESQETNLLKTLIKPGMHVVDIGANIGYHTMLMARLTGPNGQVTAFEPFPENYRLLVKNAQSNRFKTILAEQKAISNQSGKARLFLNKGNQGDHRIFKTRNERAFLEIQTTSLDDSLANRRVDLIKMDIQGAELMALKGMGRVIRQNPNIMIITEFSPDLLKKCGARPSDFLDEVEKNGLGFELINAKTGRLEPIGKSDLLTRCNGTQYENLLIKRY